MMIAILILLASFFTLFGSSPVGELQIVKYMVPFGYYQTGWLAVFLACGWIFSRDVTKKFGAPAGLLIFYLIAQGVWTSFWWRNGLEAVDGVEQLGIRWQSATSLFGLLIVIAPFMSRSFYRQDLIDLGGMMAAIFCTVSTFRVLGEFIFSPDHCVSMNSCGGVLMNPSQNTGFIVATIPFVVKYFGRKEWNYVSRVIVAAAVASVILSKSSVAIGMLGLLIAFNALHLRKWHVLLAFPLLAGLGLFLLGKREFFSNGDRLPIWTLLVKSLLLHPVHAVKAWAFGSGIGTIGVFTLSLQELFKFRDNNWWAWPHNDWLEMLLATGVIGFSLLLLNYLNAIRTFFKEREMHELLALLMFGVLTFVNPTLHVGWTALFGAWILTSGLYREAQWIG